MDIQTWGSNFATFTLTPGSHLVITLTPEGMAELDEMIERGERSDRDMFDHLTGSIFCNSEWKEVYAEEIGAITSELLLGNDVVLDEDGDLVSVGTVYWDCGPYSTMGYTDRLRQLGGFTMYAEELKPYCYGFLKKPHA